MALSGNTTLELRNTGKQMRGALQIVTSGKIWKHALTVVQGGNGKVGPAVDGTSSVFVGLAIEEKVTCSSGALTTAEYIWNCEARIPIASSITAGDVGHTIYAIDDALAGTDTSEGPPIGRMTEIDGTSYVWVWLGHLTLGSAS